MEASFTEMHYAVFEGAGFSSTRRYRILIDCQTLHLTNVVRQFFALGKSVRTMESPLLSNF